MHTMKPNDIRVGFKIITSRCEYDRDPAMWEHYAEDDLNHQLVQFIQRNKSEKTITDDFVEKRLDLYVATPEVFWGIVKEEAEKIAMQFMPR